jgi:hypothetical protein
MNKAPLKTVRITLTDDERRALSNYPGTLALQYIWIGILAIRGFKTPATLSELNVQYVHSDMYDVTTEDYSLAG